MIDDIAQIQNQLSSKSDLDWFNMICALLTKENNITVSILTNIVGVENPNINKERRGSKFLIPFDKKFDASCINPDIDITHDADIEYFSIGGRGFNLKIKDIKEKFGDPKIVSNIYDGGTQLFFYPISDSYQFTAISSNIMEETEHIVNIEDIIVHSISFHFRQNLVKHRDGYSMI